MAELSGEDRGAHSGEAEVVRDDFLQMVAHDLRNPLAAIRGFAVILAEDEGRLSAEDRQAHLQAIIRQTDRVLQLLRDVADVSRMDSGEFAYGFVVYDAAALARRATRRAQAAYPGHRFQLDVPAGLPHVRGDEDRMQQALDALLSNACRYSPAGSTVTVRAAASDGRLRLSVVDQGIGIHQKYRDQLFRRFAKIPKPGLSVTPGSGLGLYIAKAIVDAHAGRIWAETQPGKGSAFHLEVPLGGVGT